jgi:glycosyltransferase involved in cell wall biosynthesis
MRYKVAYICNSNHSEMLRLFGLKINQLGDKVSYYSSSEFAKKNNVGISSFSRTNLVSLWLVLDCVYAFILLLRLIFSGVKVIIFDSAHISNIPIAILAKVFRFRLIFTIHDWIPHEGDQQNKVKVYNKFVKKNLANEFVVFSHVKSDKPLHVMKLGGYERIKTDNNTSKNFLFFGRIEPYKGIENLINISDMIFEIDPQFKLVIAGSGDSPFLKPLSQKKNVEVINRFVTDKELEWFLSDSCCVILPYISATQSGVILHTYSASRAVVAFDVGCLDEYIINKKTGILVKNKDLGLFVNAMHEVYLNQYEYYQQVSITYDKLYSKTPFIEQYIKFTSVIGCK